MFSNRLLLAGIAFELIFAAALIYLPPLQPIFGTAALGPAEIAFLLPFPLIVWAADEAYRWWSRRAGTFDSARRAGSAKPWNEGTTVGGRP